MFRAFGLAIWIALCATAAHATDLLESIQTASLDLVSVNGTGGSSGAVLNGVIRNTTRSEIEIDTLLSNPVYFDNGSSGQNMVATQVYLSDMSYYTEGSRSFIKIASGQSVSVVFVAYCADFDLDNPEYSHSLLIADIPADLEAVARKISDYEANAAGFDVTVAAQLALWIARGDSPQSIREKFDFTDQDLALAYEILN
jgi:hypothetical protein